MKRGYADIPEGQIHFVTEGSGEPLLLLHLAPRSSRVFTELIPLLSKEYRVIAMDSPGAGNSDPLPLTARIPDLARCVVHFLDALAIAKVHLFGIHTGASIAGEVAGEYPSRVASLTLYGYTFVEDTRRRDAIFEKQERDGLFRQAADGSDLTRAWTRAYGSVVQQLLHSGQRIGDDSHFQAESPSHPYITPEGLRFMERWVLDFMQAKESIKPISRDVYNPERTQRLSRITAPTLHIQGDSPFEPPYCRRGEGVAKLIRGAKSVTLPRGDENPAEFQTRGLAQMILDFVRNHPL